MRAHQIFTSTVLTLVAAGAFAQEAAPATRAEVRQQVLAARADRTLRHAGEAGPEEMTPDRAQVEAASSLTRADGRNAVLQARAAHQLAHAGAVAPEEETRSAQAHRATSAATRLEVRQQVLAARATGTLVPAGQGGYAGAGATAGRPTFAESRVAAH